MIYKEENGQIVVRLNCQEEIFDVINALDLYSRIWIGQLLEIDNQMIWLKEKLYETDSAAKMTPFFVNIRNRILPGSLTDIGNTLHSSYGIFSKKIDRRARIAYDMQQVIRYTSAWYFHPDGGHSVDFGTPMQAEETVKMPTANCFADDHETGMEIRLTCLSQLEVFKKALSAKIYPAKMIHTGSVAEVQGEGKRLANNRNLLEKFSICPVYTGMNLPTGKYRVAHGNPPRMHGDGPFRSFHTRFRRESTPYARG